MSTDLLTVRNDAYTAGEKRGIALGERRGEQKGALSMVIKLVKLGMLPISVACEQLGITEKEFNKFLSMY